jgi:hypothetical protein
VDGGVIDALELLLDTMEFFHIGPVQGDFGNFTGLVIRAVDFLNIGLGQLQEGVSKVGLVFDFGHSDRV